LKKRGGGRKEGRKAAAEVGLKVSRSRGLPACSLPTKENMIDFLHLLKTLKKIGGNSLMDAVRQKLECV